MKQKGLELDLSTRRTRKQILLEEMDQVMPWSELLALIAPHARGLNWQRKRKSSTPACGSRRSSPSESSGASLDTSRCATAALPKHRAAGYAVCVVQHLDGQKQGFAESQGISASSHSQRAAKELKNDLSQSCTAVIDSDVSLREKYSAMSGSQTEFWT